MLSCPARRQSSHYLPAEAPPCWCEVHPVAAGSALLLWSLPFCCSLCPAAMGYTLWQSLSVVPGCLSNGRLHQQWAYTSVGADCLNNGGRPFPMELHFKKTSSPGAFGITVLFVALRYPKRCVPGISWAGSLSKSCSVSSSALSGLSFLVQQGTCNSALLYGALWSASALRCGLQSHRLLATLAKTSAWCPCLSYTWEFPRSVGNKDLSGNVV